MNTEFLNPNNFDVELMDLNLKIEAFLDRFENRMDKFENKINKSFEKINKSLDKIDNSLDKINNSIDTFNLNNRKLNLLIAISFCLNSLNLVANLYLIFKK